jgi:hypothetical protein
MNTSVRDRSRPWMARLRTLCSAGSDRCSCTSNCAPKFINRAHYDAGLLSFLVKGLRHNATEHDAVGIIQIMMRHCVCAGTCMTAANRLSRPRTLVWRATSTAEDADHSTPLEVRPAACVATRTDSRFRGLNHGFSGNLDRERRAASCPALATAPALCIPPHVVNLR